LTWPSAVATWASSLSALAHDRRYSGSWSLSWSLGARSCRTALRSLDLRAQSTPARLSPRQWCQAGRDACLSSLRVHGPEVLAAGGELERVPRRMPRPPEASALRLWLCRRRARSRVPGRAVATGGTSIARDGEGLRMRAWTAGGCRAWLPCCLVGMPRRSASRRPWLDIREGLNRSTVCAAHGRGWSVARGVTENLRGYRVDAKPPGACRPGGCSCSLWLARAPGRCRERSGKAPTGGTRGPSGLP
jgi:hypothetical protein